MNNFYPAKNSGQVQGVKCYTLAEVKKEAKGYYKIVKVSGGWRVYYSAAEYQIARKQK